MSYYALWIDHKDAVVYKFNADGVDEKKIANGEFGKHHGEKHKEIEEFYHTVAKNLTGAQELLVMGPGVAKDEFKHHCEKHNHAPLAKAIVGTETLASHPTKAEMLKKASTFFKSYHQWTKNY